MSWYSPAPSETATGQTQWELPGAPAHQELDQLAAHAAPTTSHGASKRRQYAAGQTQMYLGNDATTQPPYPGDQSGGALFTPGEQAHPPAPQQQQQPQYQGSGVFSAGGFVVPAQTSSYLQTPQPEVGVLANQFSQMGLQQQQPGYGQKQVGRFQNG